MSNLEFNADLFRIAYLNVSTDATRYYLQGVLIEPATRGRPGALMVATDGHSMLVIHDESALNVPERGVILTLGVKNKPGKLFTSGSKGTNRVSWNGELATVSRLLSAAETGHNPSCETLGAVPMTAIDASFPVWRRVMPLVGRDVERGEFPHFRVNVMAKMIAVGEAFAALKHARDLPMSCYHSDAASPMLIKWGSSPAVGVAMPQRETYNPDMPAWL